MKVRTTRVSVLGMAVIVFVAALALPMQAQAQAAKGKAKAAEAAPAESAPAVATAVSTSTASGQYKIGVVNRKDVLEKYTKVKAEYAKLQDKVKADQVGIDTLSTTIESMKADYEKNKGTMTTEDRATKEAEIQKKYSEYRSELEEKQRVIDAEEQRLMKTVLSEVDTVVAKIADAEGYHLVLEGGGRGGVIYSSPTIDITQKVVDALNSGK